MEPNAKHAVSTLAMPISKSLIADDQPDVLAASVEEFSEERLRDLLAREPRHSAQRCRVAINHCGSAEGVLRQSVGR